MDRRRDVAFTRAQLVVGDECHRHRADEVVTLNPGVLPGHLRQLSGQRGGEGLEAVEVLGSEVDTDVVRSDRHAVAPDGAVRIEGAGDLPAHLDRLQTAREGLPEAALDELLEATFETLESHGARVHGDATQIGLPNSLY